MSRELRMVEEVRRIERFVYVCDNPDCEAEEPMSEEDYGKRSIPPGWYFVAWRDPDTAVSIADPSRIACSPDCVRAALDDLALSYATPAHSMPSESEHA